MENEVLKCIKERRSIRNFEKRKIEKEFIEKIIEAGKFAPSPENRQPWKFIVVSNEEIIKWLSQETKREIRKILKMRWILKFRYQELKERETMVFLKAVSMAEKDVIFYEGPLVIFIVSEDRAFNLEACACAAQNMMLVAWSFGIGSCWIGFAKFLERNRKAREKIGVPLNHIIGACLAFGYPSRIPKAPIRNPMAGIIRWI